MSFCVCEICEEGSSMRIFRARASFFGEHCCCMNSGMGGCLWR